MTGRYAMLGTLAHRAVLMSFGRQWSGHQFAATPMVDQIAANTELLLDAARRPDAATPNSLLRCIADPGGPYWGGLADDWAALSDVDRDWVLEHLPIASSTAARRLAEDDRTQRWRTARSEVRLNRLDAGADGQHQRGEVADLVVTTADGRLVLIDLKFVHAGLPGPDADFTAAERQVRNQIKLARAACREPGATRCTRPVSGWLLYVAYRDGVAGWREVTNR